MKKSTVKSIAFAAAACLTVMPFFSFAEVKALSFAINEANTSNDETPIQTYMGQNDVDFGVFDFGKASTYFVNADFTNNGRNFKAAWYQNGNVDYKFILYSDRYELVNVPDGDKSGNNITAVFKDEYGDQFALISIRGTYKDDKVSATLGPVKTYIDGIATKYPDAKIIVTYNARLSGTYATTGNTYMDILNTYLTETASGPQMTCLGRVQDVGGFYMAPGAVPATYSVAEVPSSIGTLYSGTLATLGFPTKCKVIFNDWDGTGLQTNIVLAGESVTPPTVPGRDGYTFTGWDHPASDFASVPASFTATAQYASNAAWLNISGDPENLGTAAPVYGAITEIAASDTFTATISNPAVEEGATERWVCTGYTHYEITDVATGAKTVAQEGSTASFAYTHVLHDELVWHFTNEWLVVASATSGGSVSATEAWVRNGEALQLVATPDQGWEFIGWRGDTNDVADVASASIAPTITAARTLRAAFAPVGADASVQYVAATGSDANDGYSAGSPKLTIQAAVNTLAEAAGHGTVHVAAGLYQISISESIAVADAVKANVAVANPIAIVGATGDPEDVIVRNTSTYNNAQVIVFYLNHPGASVANLTAENGHRNAQDVLYGCNVAIDAAGGTVSNCIVRGANSIGNYSRGAGAWLNSDSALLTHCVITNNSAATGGYQYTEGIGVFVHVAAGKVANCLIADNHDSSGTATHTNDKQDWANGVAVVNGALLNCTIATNEARYTAGVYLHPTGYATNVVVAGCVNRCTSYVNDAPKFTDIGFKGTIANASHCASDGGEALDSTCIAGTAESFFENMAAHDYHPAKGSRLVNKGVRYDGIASFDLLGKKRVQGRAPDIGCYESAPSELVVIIR